MNISQRLPRIILLRAGESQKLKDNTFLDTIRVVQCSDGHKKARELHRWFICIPNLTYTVKDNIINMPKYGKNETYSIKYEYTVECDKAETKAEIPPFIVMGEATKEQIPNVVEAYKEFADKYKANTMKIICTDKTEKLLIEVGGIDESSFVHLMPTISTISDFKDSLSEKGIEYRIIYEGE